MSQRHQEWEEKKTPGASLVPLTKREAELLAAWREYRRKHPDLQPTVADMARACGCGRQAAWNRMCGLARKGHLVRDDRKHDSKKTSRLYSLTSEAAARPHLASLVKIATAVLKVPPSAVESAHREAFHSAYARATVVLRDIVALCRELGAQDQAPPSRTAATMRSWREKRPQDEVEDGGTAVGPDHQEQVQLVTPRAVAGD